MATVGNGTTPTAGWDWRGTPSEAATQYTMPTGGGVVTHLHGYFDTYNGNGARGWLCIWDSSGNIIVSAGGFTINNGSQNGGGQQWWDAACTPTYIAGGTTIWIGFYAEQSLLFSTESGGVNSSQKTGLANGGPSSFSGASSTGYGAVGAYADYTPGNAWVKRGGVWVGGQAYVKRSGVWQPATVYVKRSGVWVQGD